MRKNYNYIKILTVVWIVYFLIKDFDVIRTDVISVLILWSGTLIPSLFPYLVLSSYLTSTGALLSVSQFLFPIKRILSLSYEGVGVWLCSLFCGYPSGAICTSELYSDGKISKNEAERLLCFTNNAGPLFLISAVGECMLGSVEEGVFIFLIQTISAFVTGVVLSVGFNEKAENMKNEKTSLHKKGKSFCECCQSSVNAMLMICAYAVCASVVSKIILLSLNAVLIQLPSNIAKWTEGIVYAIFEISTALSKISTLNRTPLTLPVICAIVSWSGISVMLQIKSVIAHELGIKKVILFKFFQSILSFGFALLYQGARNKISFGFSTDSVMKISLMISIVIFVLFVLINRNQKPKAVR